MALTQKRLFGPAAAVTSPTDDATGRYVVPTATTTIVKQILICNTAASGATVRVAVGTTATAANRIISDLTLAASETVSFNCSLVMAAAEKLFFVASATTVTITVNGVEEA
jgi:hypothetical protein